MEVKIISITPTGSNQTIVDVIAEVNGERGNYHFHDFVPSLIKDRIISTYNERKAIPEA
jgi:hypothetical protein